MDFSYGFFLCKMVGMILVVYAFWLFAHELQKKLKERWQLLRELEESFRYLEKEMAVRRTPVSEALPEIAGMCAGRLKNVLVQVSEAVMDGSGLSFRDIWQSSLEKNGIQNVFSDENWCVILESADALCCSDPLVQQTVLQKYADRFHDLSARAESEYREKGDFYKKMSAAAGAFVIILLL